MIEFWIWIGTMYLTSAAYLMLTRRYHKINPWKAAVPMANAKFMSRLALTNAVNYGGFAIIGTYCFFAYPQFLVDALAVMKEWFIVEVFIFWNLRTAALIILGLRNTKVEI